MIDHRLLKPAGAVVLADAAAAALTVGQSAFAAGGAHRARSFALRRMCCARRREVAYSDSPGSTGNVEHLQDL